MTFNYPQIAAAVYQACTGYDQYLPQLSEDVARAWAKVFQRYGLTADDLIAGVDAVYAIRGSGYRPLPADIAEAARSIRQAKAMQEPESVRTARQEALAAKAAEDVAALAERKGLPGPVKFKRPTAERRRDLSVRCPWCRAAVGVRCVNQATRLPRLEVHPSRREAAQEAVNA